MNLLKHAQRSRNPLHPLFEKELTNKLQKILIDNYEPNKKATRFDFLRVKQ